MTPCPGYGSREDVCGLPSIVPWGDIDLCAECDAQRRADLAKLWAQNAEDAGRRAEAP
jgi:hypothetical protein